MVTIVDVARHAGVSPSTVSYVFSGKRAISAETKRRVERSVAELGYHPTGFVVQNEGAIGPLIHLLCTSGRTVPQDASVVALCTE